MTPLRSRRAAPFRRRLGAAISVLFCLSLGGCGLIENEFTWLDRMPPKPAAPLGGVPAAQFVGH